MVLIKGNGIILAAESGKSNLWTRNVSSLRWTIVGVHYWLAASSVLTLTIREHIRFEHVCSCLLTRGHHLQKVAYRHHAQIFAPFTQNQKVVNALLLHQA